MMVLLLSNSISS
jgi:hypothetical protein